MTDIIEPSADAVFEAVAIDVSDQGIVHRRPTNEAEWAKVMQGAMMLAESTNLLKMHPRPAVPADYHFDPSRRGPGAPELAPADITRKIEADRARWDQHADQLRAEVLKIEEFIKARDVDGLFDAGSDLHLACESCHLEYWYPADKYAARVDALNRAASGQKEN
jgi:hypothetical protein